MQLIGTVGKDWIEKMGFHGEIGDDLLRGWRDHLEYGLSAKLSIQADLGISDETRFKFSGVNDEYSITEIESFARRDLDVYLNKQSAR